MPDQNIWTHRFKHNNSNASEKYPHISILINIGNDASHTGKMLLRANTVCITQNKKIDKTVSSIALGSPSFSSMWNLSAPF